MRLLRLGFRSQRSVDAARLRGRMLAQQWLHDIKQQHVRLTKLSRHNARMLKAIQAAQEAIR